MCHTQYLKAQSGLSLEEQLANCTWSTVASLLQSLCSVCCSQRWITFCRRWLKKCKKGGREGAAMVEVDVLSHNSLLPWGRPWCLLLAGSRTVEWDKGMTEFWPTAQPTVLYWTTGKAPAVQYSTKRTKPFYWVPPNADPFSSKFLLGVLIGCW